MNLGRMANVNIFRKVRQLGKFYLKSVTVSSVHLLYFVSWTEYSSHNLEMLLHNLSNEQEVYRKFQSLDIFFLKRFNYVLL